jgi:hypothetical protein
MALVLPQSALSAWQQNMLLILSMQSLLSLLSLLLLLLLLPYFTHLDATC